MKTLEQLQKGTVELQHAAIWEGLDRLGIGLFRLNNEGYLIQFNDAAAAILGIDHASGWDELHISKADRVLGLGLADQFDTIIRGSSTFVRRNLN